MHCMRCFNLFIINNANTQTPEDMFITDIMAHYTVFKVQQIKSVKL